MKVIAAYPIDTETKRVECEVEVGLVADHGAAHVVVRVLHALLVPVHRHYHLKY